MSTLEHPAYTQVLSKIPNYCIRNFRKYYAGLEQEYPRQVSRVQLLYYEFKKYKKRYKITDHAFHHGTRWR